MDACNFPEFLALDLETAESIFAAKRMTAGLPRSLGAIHGSPEVIQHQDLLSSDFIAQLKDAVTCSSANNNLTHTTSCTREPFQAATAAMSATGQGHGHSKRSASVDSAQSDSETDSIDSFVVANNNSSSVPSRRVEPKSRGHPMLSQASRFTEPLDSMDNDTRGNAVHGNLRNTNSRISHRTRDSYASYEGYGSLFGDYDYADDYDNYTIPSDAESVSSFGVSVPTSSRDRQQSVVTTATSVSSSDRHTSVQSHILSAMGPFPPVCEPRHSGQSARSGASFGRRVEFNLDTLANDDRSMDPKDISAPKDTSTTTRNSDTPRRKRHSKDAPTSAAIVYSAPSESCTDDDSNRKGHCSWLNFDEDGSDDGHSAHPASAHDNDSKNGPPAFKANPFSRSAVAVDQRPRTSHGQSSSSASGRERELGGDPTLGPRTGSLALRRRSSLDAGQLGAWENASSNLQQRRRLRHIAPLRELSVLRDVVSAAAPSWFDNESVLSPKSRNPGSDKQAVSPMSSGPPKPSTAVAETVDEVPLVLQNTVYRQPNTEHGTEKGNLNGCGQQQAAADRRDCTGQMQSNQSSSEVENLRSYFDDDDDDECDDNCTGVEAMGSNGTSRFDDFGTDIYRSIGMKSETTSVAAKPFSRQAIGSIRSVHSRFSVSSTNKAGSKRSLESYPVACHGVASDAGLVNAEKTSSDLQYWLRHASEQQNQQDRRLPPPKPAAGNGFFASQQIPLAEEDEASPVVSPPFDYSSFYHPGVVGIPLPRDVVETLRVSVSCFPETMLSLSSFSIQTIRSYSRKVRRCSPSDADSTFRLLMAPALLNGVQLSQNMATPFVPPFVPPSPTAASFRNATSDPETDLRRTVTGVSVGTTASHRFWKLPKRLGSLRPSSSSNSLSCAGNAASLSSGRPSSPHVRNLREDNNGLESTLPDDGQGKGSGICFKRIFPTGSDYLCDALYAHIIAFNYISLLCPPADAKPVCLEPALGALSGFDARPQTSGGNTITTTSTATLIENGDKTRRQTIRIYMGSDVALHSPSSDSVSQLEGARPASPAAPMEDYTAMLESPPPSPPPSRGRSDDSNRLISRKAASLLGITELLEPDMSNNSVLLKRNHQSVGSGLARRYHTMRQRHLRTTGSSPPGGNEAATTKKPVVANASKRLLEISKPLPVQPDIVSATVPTVPTTPTATLSMSGSTPAVAPASLPQPPLPPAAPTPSDSHLRDLQAGLHHCISQLVSTLKLTTGQLGSTTLLTTETARELDPLFLRMLCELVRSQEELI